METLDQATLRVGNERRTVPFVPGNALFDTIRRDGYFPSGDEAALSYGGVAYVIQPASAEHRPHRVYRVKPPEWSHVTFVEERPISDMPYYSQRHIGRLNACGLACVASLIEHATGEKQNVAALSMEFDKDEDGTTAYDLVDAGAKHHVPLKAIQDKDATIDILPAIVLHRYAWDKSLVEYKSFDGWHWSLLLAIDADWVTLHDPLYAGQGGRRKRYPRRQWDERCYLADSDQVRWYVVHNTSPGAVALIAAADRARAPKNDVLDVE